MKHARLLYGALVLVGLTLTGYLYADFLQYEQTRERKSIRLGEQAGTRVADALDAELNAISERAGIYAAEIAGNRNERQLLQSIREESLRFPLLLGVPGELLILQ